MSDVVEEYEKELTDLLADVAGRLLRYKDGKEAGGKQVKELEALLGQASDLLKQMSVEVRSMDGNEKKEKTVVMDGYKSRVESARDELKATTTNRTRAALLGDSVESHGQRQRYMDTNEKLNRQNEALLQAQRTVAETEDVGSEIAENLTANREKIESSQAKLRELHGDLDSADRITKSMQDRGKCIIA
jgi:vesicle transport through interaction with t-SNAREs 1